MRGRGKEEERERRKERGKEKKKRKENGKWEKKEKKKRRGERKRRGRWRDSRRDRGARSATRGVGHACAVGRDARVEGEQGKGRGWKSDTWNRERFREKGFGV